MRLKTTPQQTPLTSYSTATAAPSVATSAAASATTSTPKATHRVATKRRTKLPAARVVLWATFLTPLILVGSYLTRPVPRIALAPRTEIVSQNGQMFARRILSPEGVSQLAVGRVGGKPLWTEEFSNEGIVAFSPDGRSIVTESTQGDLVPEFTFQCRDTVTRAEVWRRFGPASATTTPLGSNAAAVSPDGALVAMAVDEGLRFYSLQTGEFIRFLRTAPNNLEPDVQLRFSPDGQTLTATQASGTREFEMRF
ncbi:WD40 repeat domain-containing protein [Armatimonas sp.]|uniref:WD40 repeat domain-containing protein n=1 Tax=Armatimonas sp. TaxID=1872638 RepID=UPI00374DF488